MDLVSIENPNDTTKNIINSYIKWKANGFSAKVVLKATQNQLEELMKDPRAHHIRDAGKTQIAPNSLTVVGFYPALKTQMAPITSDYKLL